MRHYAIKGAVLLISVLVSFSYLSTSSASLRAQPAYLYVDLDKHNPSGTFTVTNLGNEAQTYRASATHFVLTESGSIVVIKPDDYSLAKWIKFNPKEFTLPPKSSRQIRFTIIAKKNLKPQEYWGAIQFMPLTGQRYSQEDESGHHVQFQLITALLIPIYGETLGVNYGGSVDRVDSEQTSQLHLGAVIHNTGDGGLRLRGQWEVSNSETGDVVLSKEVDPILLFPQRKRRLKLDVDKPLPPGHYVTRIRLEQKSPKLFLTGQNEFAVK